AFNIGGVLGALAAIPLAKWFSRRTMFILYFAYSALALFTTFGLDLTPQARMWMLFFVGLGTYGIFSTFIFYLPELFPTRLRAMGGGFSYNFGRVIAAVGPVVVGSISAASGGSSEVIVRTMFWIGVIPLVTAIAGRWFIVETRGKPLPV
ncbi:MAG TPA: hypothetical protein VIL32_09500, partial [Steroidobacteraceae bacterium]